MYARKIPLRQKSFYLYKIIFSGPDGVRMRLLIHSFGYLAKHAMTFYLPMELPDEEDKPMQEVAEKGARAAVTPFVSFFAPNEILILARNGGFKEPKTISTKDMEQYYFTNRTDNLLPAIGKVFLLATT